jgi:hypothetical protein
MDCPTVRGLLAVEHKPGENAVASIFDLSLAAHARQAPITAVFFTVLSQVSGFHESWEASILYGAAIAIGMHAIVYGIGWVMRR